MKKVLVAVAAFVAMLGTGIHPAQAAEEVSAKPLIGLSFDDGPDPVRTPLILAQLAATNTKATFFLLGKNVKKYPAIVKLIQQQGHVIGNHGYDHVDFADVDEDPANGFQPLTYDQAKKSIVDTNAEIKKVTGADPILFRYPYGDESESGNKVIRELGMWGGVLWDWHANPTLPKKKIFTGDWDCAMTATDVQAYILANARSQSIILLHDGGDSSSCKVSHFTFLTPSINTLKAQGFDFGVVKTANGPSWQNGYSWVTVAK